MEMRLPWWNNNLKRIELSRNVQTQLSGFWQIQMHLHRPDSESEYKYDE